MSEKWWRDGPRRWCPSCQCSWPEEQPDGSRRITCPTCYAESERMTDQEVQLRYRANEQAADRSAELERFADELEKRGVFARRYDKNRLYELYDAARALHSHLCKLDTSPFRQARSVTISDFADAYAALTSGLRRLGKESS